MPRVFISYSHQDEECKKHIVSHLNVPDDDGLDVWDDRKIAAGADWFSDIKAAIAKCDVALLLISRHFLTSKFITQEEVPELLRLRESEGVRVIPVILAPCAWQHIGWLSPIQAHPVEAKPLSGMSAHDADEAIVALVGEVLDLPRLPSSSILQTTFTPQRNICIDQLPTVPGEFFGRQEQLELLNSALTDRDTRIIQFIAAGGTGKTKLLRHWLNQTEQETPNRIIWSFYSQGTTEAKQVSSSPMFTAGFKAFKVDESQYTTDEDKADAFADLLIQHQCLLVLDGLEPLQSTGAGLDGRLKDRALSHLLKRLSAQSTSSQGALCIITTRIEVYDLKGRAHVVSHPLDNLQTQDGVALLQSHEVKARQAVLEGIVKKINGHALTLHLLGNAIQTHLDEDALKLDTLENWLDPYDAYGKHAFKVMSSYESGLRDEQGEPLAELQLLYLLGLFDHPIETQVLKVLWDAQIPKLTQGIAKQAWNHAMVNLRDKHHLLSQHQSETDSESSAEPAPTKPALQLLDCHPLIREYFGGQLKHTQPAAWQKAHETLYEYYKSLPEKQQPDKLEEMRPLFAAVAHGCAAGLHQQALYEVFWARIRREGDNYLCKKLGAFSDDLAAASHFFSMPWHTPAAGLIQADQAIVLILAGFDLRALGRLREALQPMRAGMEMQAKQEDWKQAANAAGNLSELQLTLGHVEAAQQSAAQAVDYADRAEDWFEQMNQRAKYADAAFQAGENAQALALFQKAEVIQQEHQPNYPRLYSVRGFRYCDLLLALAGNDVVKIGEVIERTEYALEISIKYLGNGLSLLDIGLDHLTLARAQLKTHVLNAAQQDWANQGQNNLEKAIAGLRASGSNHHLPRALLTQATQHRLNQNYVAAQQVLTEIYELAEPSEMLLHLTDYHLEAAQLAHAMAQPEKSQNHLKQAAALIQKTGYHRRDEALAKLQRELL